MRRVPAALLGLSIAVVSGGMAFGQAKAPAPPASDSVELLKKPMILYVARGESDACGPGCNEWIAAEGAFDTGSARRLRAFISRPRNAKLPIYFHSPGGLADRAFNIGRLLRERGMTAGVSRTLPEACSKLDDKACDALKRSGQVLTAELSPMAGCNSACVFALIGSKVREVPPGARLGVHSSKLVKLFSDGRIVAVKPGDAKIPMSQRDASTRKYISEMGINVQLFEIAAKIPHESAHYLSRDEIANLGIDAREFQETGWMVASSKTVSVLKLFVEAKGPEHKEFRLGVIRLSCSLAGRTDLVYLRGLASNENGRGQAVGLIVGGKEFPLIGVPSATTLDALDTGSSFDRWGTFHADGFLKQAAEGGSLAIAVGTAGRPLQSATATPLSTAGLSRAIATLREKCGGEAAAASVTRAPRP